MKLPKKGDKPAERLWVRTSGHTKMGVVVVDVCKAFLKKMEGTLCFQALVLVGYFTPISAGVITQQSTMFLECIDDNFLR